jgi:hypothetical protein
MGGHLQGNFRFLLSISLSWNSLTLTLLSILFLSGIYTKLEGGFFYRFSSLKFRIFPVVDAFHPGLP